MLKTKIKIVKILLLACLLFGLQTGETRAFLGNEDIGEIDYSQTTEVGVSEDLQKYDETGNASGDAIDWNNINEKSSYQEEINANIDEAQSSGLGVVKSLFGGNASSSSGKASLKISPNSAPSGVPKFQNSYIASKWTSNDALLANLYKESLIFKIITIAKYILGGVFMLFFGLYVLNFLHATNKEEQVTKFKDQMLWAFAGFIILALAKPFSESLTLVGFGDTGALLTDPKAVIQSAMSVGFTYRSAAHLIQYLLGGIALVAMGVSALRIITATGDEESVKNARKAIAWSAIGLIIAGGSAIFIDRVFAPVEASQIIAQEINIDDARRITQNYALTDLSDPLTQHEVALAFGRVQARITVLTYVKYFQTFVGAAAVLMLFLSGFKMVTAAGQEEIVTKQRKMITWIFMGLAVILIAETFVNIFMPEKDGMIIFQSDQAIQSFSNQIGGFTNFVLTFSSALAVLALIVGALYLTTAVANPEQAENGKKILLAAVLGLVVTISAYALVNTVLSQNPNGDASSDHINLEL